MLHYAARMSKTSEKLMRELVTKPHRSVTELAQMLVISRPALSNVLNGNADLSIGLALKLEEKFGMNANKLLINQLGDKVEEARAHVYGGDDV